MLVEDRKAAVAAWKERKSAPGIYVVRCTASGESWVGRAPDLATMQTRLWFTLRMGSNPHRALQAAWRLYGGEHFSFKEVERLEDDLSPGLMQARLRTRLDHWAEQLGAAKI
ncbi:MAG TPA: GIY-YIG nuclease family protein [Allosphingosinicella sp.]|jgi:hypothetical protein